MGGVCGSTGKDGIGFHRGCYSFIGLGCNRRLLRRADTFARVIVVILALPLITVVGINFYHARSAKAFAPCIANLMQIEGGKETWATENHKTKEDIPFD